MNNRDWERFGEDIRQTIQDAVEYGNYEKLNQTITNTVNQAADWISRNVKNSTPPHMRGQHMGGTRMGGPHMGAPYMGNFNAGPDMGKRQETYQHAKYQKKMPDRYKINTSSKVAAILSLVFGGAFGVPLFFWSLILLIGAVLAVDFSAGFWIVLIPSVILLGAFLFLGFTGIKKLLNMHRFNLYRKEIGNSEMCNISVLASSVGKSIAYVVKDIEKMIRKGWFRQGHLDRQKTCLIVTDKMYHQYQQLETQKELQRKEEEQRLNKQQQTQQAQKASRKGLSPEVQKVIDQGDAYVRKIRECNDAIPGEEISAKIYRIEVVVDKIFDRVEQNPETVSDIRKLMDYYLPTTVKLLEAYAEMDAQPIGGENIQTAKREIEATLDTLNVAFEKLLDSMFQNAAWDVSSDISVLNTMLAQEGLKEDGLQK